LCEPPRDGECKEMWMREYRERHRRRQCTVRCKRQLEIDIWLCLPV